MWSGSLHTEISQMFEEYSWRADDVAYALDKHMSNCVQRHRDRMREYMRTPDAKKRQRARQQTAEYKAYQRAYYNEYKTRPAVIEKRRIQQRARDQRERERVRAWREANRQRYLELQRNQPARQRAA